jgi:hypothetical protein
LLISSDALFFNHRAKLVAPASGCRRAGDLPYREVTQADGLLSYGTNIADIVRQAGVMAGKVLTHVYLIG